MVRKLLVAALVVLGVAGLALAGETKEATGTVKTVTGNALTVTDNAAKDWTFDVDKDTLIVAKGASHKSDKLELEGKPATLKEFLAEKENVIVKYWEKDGKMIAKEVRVK